MTEPTAPRREAGFAQGITLLLPSSLSTMAIVVLVPILPLLLAHFRDMPHAEYWVPMLLTMPSACLILASPLAGLAADLVGRRRLLIGSMAVYAALGMAPLVLDGYWPILVSRAGVGVVEAVILTVSTTLIGDFFTGAARNRWLGYQVAVASLSATVLLLVGGLLSTFGWRGPFAVYGSALLLMLAIIRFTWEPAPPRPGARAATGQGSWAGFPFARLLGICMVTLFASILFYLVQIELPILFATRGLPPGPASGLWQAVVSLGVPLGSMTFHRLADRPSQRLLVLAFGILGAGFLWMGLAASLPGLMGAAFLNQIGAGIVLPTLLTWAVRGLPYEHRGRGTGLWQGTFSVGQFAMPFTVTLLGKLVGSLEAAIAVLGAGALLAAILFAVAAVRSPPARPAPALIHSSRGS